jgi:HlyD family secretion protein
MAQQRKWLGVAIGIAVVVLVVVGLANRDQSPQVETARMKRENLSAFVTSNGKVEPIEPYVMRARLDAFVARLNATAGQPVHRGQPILSLDAADARAQLAQARGDLIAAEEDLRAARAGGPAGEVAQLEGDLRKAQVNLASLEHAQDALKRLVAQHAATQDELDQNRLAVERAKAELQTLEQRKADLARRAGLGVQRDQLRVQQAREQIENLGRKVNSSEVTSPVDGTLYSLPVHAGDYIQVGAVLAEAADLRRVRVRAFVDEPDLGWLEPNQEVEVGWDALPGRVWTGRTEQIPKQVVPHGARSVGEVLCSMNNDKLELIPNTNVDVRIRVRARPNALVVPRVAVHSDDSHHFVFLIQNGRLHQRVIQVGIANATEYEVLSGLNEGDRVALPGEVELRDGMDVHALEPKEGAGE